MIVWTGTNNYGIQIEKSKRFSKIDSINVYSSLASG